MPLPSTREPGSVRLVLSLALAGLISGIAIIGVYEATLPTITANKARELREAVFKVLPGVARMQRLEFIEGSLQPTEGGAVNDQTLYGGYTSNGDLVGYAIPADGPGFQDTIRLLYGYLPKERKIVGMEILESRETPGLGDKIYKDLVFVANFSNLVPDPEILTVKKGTRSAANEVDAITGATISSKAVVRIINEAHIRWQPRLPSVAPAMPLPDNETGPETGKPPREIR
ncbi:MAG: FMN-binding protein [Gammaproteobacteria bacterium]|nr:FMN-binding protein [Gammaproteobacteria bacterium]